MSKAMNYNLEFQILNSLLYPMAQISDNLTKNLDDKKLYIEISLFAKFVLTAFSLSKLLPVGERPQQNAAADIASVATLGRSLIEMFNLLYFLRVDEISEEEAEFRRLIATYHFRREMQKVGEKMEVNIEELSKHKETVLEAYKAKVERHPFFESLQPRFRKRILTGESALYLDRKEITRKYCRSYKLLDALYKIMSNHVHSGVYGFVLSFDKSAFGCDNEKNREQIAGLLYLVNYYVGLALVAILMIYPAKKEYVPKEAAKLMFALLKRF